MFFIWAFKKMSKVYYLGFADDEFRPSTVGVAAIMEKANLVDGWCQRRTCRFEKTRNIKQTNALLHVWPNSKIENTFPGMGGFSVTDLAQHPPRIYFNLENIRAPPATYKGSKDEYLAYVVQHELGHAIFKITKHDEEDDRHPVTKMCSIMYQQTRGTTTCRPGYKHHHRS